MQQETVAETNLRRLKRDLVLDQDEFNRQLGEVQKQMSGLHGKKTLKEISLLAKQERARLALIFEKFKVQKLLEITKLELLRCKHEKRMQQNQQDNILEERKQPEADQQSDCVTIESEMAALDVAEQQQQQQEEQRVVETQMDQCRLEEQEALLNKRLDAINTMWDRKDEDWAGEPVGKNGVLHMMLSESLQNDRKEYNALVIKHNEQVRAGEQKKRDFDQVLNRDHEDIVKKLAEFEKEVYQSKRTLKEMGEIMKRETAKLQRILRKKELEIKREEIVELVLPHKREAETLLLRDLKMRDEEDAYFRKLFPDGENGLEKGSSLRKHLSDRRESSEKCQTDLLNLREKIRVLEEDAISVSKELAAIDLAMVNDDEEYTLTEAALSTSVGDNMRSAPPSSSASPRYELEKDLSHGVEEANLKSQQVLASSQQKYEYKSDVSDRKMHSLEELYYEKQRELDLLFGEFDKKSVYFPKVLREHKQKVDELQGLLKRGEENLERQLVELKADAYKSKKTLKEMGDIIKRESAQLQRTWLMKELEIRKEVITSQQEMVVLQLEHARGYEAMQIKQLDYCELRETIFRGYRHTPDREIELLEYKDMTEKVQAILTVVRGEIRGYEEMKNSLREKLDVINNKIDSLDDATNSAADTGCVNSSTENTVTEASLSTSVGGNTPFASEVSTSISPPFERQKDMSHNVAEQATKEDERKEAKEDGKQETKKGLEPETETRAARKDREMAEFNEQIRVKMAGLAKKKEVIANVNRKITDLLQKFQDYGYLQADNERLRTDLSTADRLVADPMMITYEK